MAGAAGRVGVGRPMMGSDEVGEGAATDVPADDCLQQTEPGVHASLDSGLAVADAAAVTAAFLDLLLWLMFLQAAHV